MEDGDIKKKKLMILKEELEALSDKETELFLFEFMREPMAYIEGRFSDALSLNELKETLHSYSEKKLGRKELLAKIDTLLQMTGMIEDPYDREILYAIASAAMAFIKREHAFDAVLHDLDAIVIDVGFDKSLAVIPLRIKHHMNTINKVRSSNCKNGLENNFMQNYSRLIS